MDGEENKTRPGWEAPQQEQGSLWKNIGKLIFLVAMLAISWFVLEWLIEGK